MRSGLAGGPGVEALLPLGVLLRAARDGLAGVLDDVVRDLEGLLGVEAEDLLDGRNSSAPSAEPWILPVFCFLGAGQPMIVLQDDQRRLVGDRLAR